MALGAVRVHLPGCVLGSLKQKLKPLLDSGLSPSSATRLHEVARLGRIGLGSSPSWLPPFYVKEDLLLPQGLPELKLFY